MSGSYAEHRDARHSPQPSPAPAAPASAVERFVEAFLQERNIKWMLGIGAMILLGSSLMFVSEHWSAMAPIWKYMVLVGYTGLIHAGGQLAYHRLALRRTGTALMAVTLLLIPLVFFSLHWVSAGTAVQSGTRLLFVVGALALSALASRRILTHFFRSPQPAVQACYLSLACLGAIAPALPRSWGPLWALGAWAVFAFGAIRANREIFWMLEEHRLPRIFGFFPIALLGTQFLALFALNFARSFPTPDWLGLAAVLTAIPILSTAESVARVFRRRTGNLVRPLPWSVMGPIVAGLVLCIGGLGLALTGLPRPFALVPTALLFAVVMATMAGRTGQPGFAWAMLAGIGLAYQFSPLFFLNAARAFTATTAAALHEGARLPLAYYGLTWLPLLAGFSVTGWRLQQRERAALFCGPLHATTRAVSVALFLASFANPGANFLVAGAMTGFFLWQAVAAGDRRMSVAGIVAFVTFSVRLVPFAEQLWQVQLPANAGVFAVGTAVLLLQILGPRIDGMLDRLVTRSSKDWPLNWSRAAGLVAIGTVGWWICRALPVYLSEPALWSGSMLLGLLALQAFITPQRCFGELTLSFGLLLATVHARFLGVDSGSAIVMACMALLALWCVGMLTRERRGRAAVAFSAAARRVSALLLLAAIGATVWAIAGFGILRWSLNWPVVCSGLVGIVWTAAFGFIRQSTRGRRDAAVCTGFVAALALTWPLVATFAGDQWVPAAWAAVATIAITVPLRRPLQETARCPVARIGLLVLLLVAAASFVELTLPLAIAGTLALAGLLVHAALTANRSLRLLSVIAITWQLVGLPLQFLAPGAQTVLELTLTDLTACSLPVAAVAAMAATAFQHPRVRGLAGDDATTSTRNILNRNANLLAAAACGGLLVSFSKAGPGLTLSDAACALIAFSGLAATSLTTAWRQRSVVALRLAEATVCFAGVFLWAFDLLQLPAAASSFCLLALACVYHAASLLAARREHSRFAAGPLQVSAKVLPLVVALLAPVRFMTVPGETWLGLNSLAVLMAAAFYFWRGIEEQRRGLLVLAAAIVNLGLLLTWHELRVTDPQFFMIPIGVTVIGLVEVLKRDLPLRARDPLRYAGALMILVSPTFHIVTGSWLHLVSLLLSATLVALVAIGLRVRPLLYTGSAFLLADLAAMVIRGSIDHPDLLWLTGLVAGLAVIALAALFENRRENLLSRMRLLAAELRAWD